MEDEKKQTAWEDVNLNSTKKEEVEESTNPEESKASTVEELEAKMKEMQSNSEKWVQKLITEKKVYEKAFNEMSKISDDSERLIELFEEDQSTAELILSKYFGDESIDEYKERTWYEEDYSNPKVFEAKIKKEATKMAENNLIEAEKQIFIDKLKMSDEEKTSFEETFRELRQLRSFNTKNLTKRFEKAYRLSNDNEDQLKKLNQQEAVAKTLATTEGKSSSKTLNEKEKSAKRSSDYNKNFLRERWII